MPTVGTVFSFVRPFTTYLYRGSLTTVPTLSEHFSSHLWSRFYHTACTIAYPVFPLKCREESVHRAFSLCLHGRNGKPRPSLRILALMLSRTSCLSLGVVVNVKDNRPAFKDSVCFVPTDDRKPYFAGIALILHLGSKSLQVSTNC